MKTLFIRHFACSACCGVAITGFVFADDIIITKSGLEIRAKIKAFKDGKIVMIDDGGKEQSGNISNIKEIQFDVMPLPMVVPDGSPNPKQFELNPEEYKGKELVFLKCEFSQDVDRDNEIYSTYITFSDGTFFKSIIDSNLMKVMIKDLEGGYHWTNCGIRIKVPENDPKKFFIAAVDVYSVGGTVKTSYRLDEKGQGVRSDEADKK